MAKILPTRRSRASAGMRMATDRGIPTDEVPGNGEIVPEMPAPPTDEEKEEPGSAEPPTGFRPNKPRRAR